MTWQTNPLVVSLRDAGRALGVNGWIAARFAAASYEAAFDEALAASVRPGDVVWDVGANVGHYTSRFARAVGTEGLVVAFEPSPENYQRLVQTCALLPNVVLQNYGLGRQGGRVQFSQGADPLGATSRVVSSGNPGQEVELRSGACALEQAGLKAPNVVKIDVEGYELEVLEGLGPILQSPSLRVIAVEIHFRLLKERGLASAPRHIETLFRTHAFDVRWADSSHLLATRAQS